MPSHNIIYLYIYIERERETMFFNSKQTQCEHTIDYHLKAEIISMPEEVRLWFLSTYMLALKARIFYLP